MKLAALIASLIFVTHASLPAVVAANDWAVVSQATAQQSTQARPALMYNPKLTIEENNSKIRRQDPKSHMLVSVLVPRQQLHLQHIADRPVTFNTGNRVFHGRVSAMFLDGDGSTDDVVRIQAQLINEKHQDHWLLKHGDTGTLHIQN